MAGFLILANIGTWYVFGYYLFGGNEATLYFGIAFWVIGSVLAMIKDFQLTKELKSLRKCHIEISDMLKGYLKPDIYAEFDNPSLAELYAERHIKKGYHAIMESKKDGSKTIVKIYKEKEDNEQEINK